MNRGATSRVVRISYVASERATDVKPALKRYLAATATNAADWADFASAERTLAVGEEWSVRFSLDRAQLSPGTVYGALVKVEDVSGPTGMRLLVPVSAAWSEASADNDHWPQGLWVGKVTLSQVSTSTNLTPVAAGGKIEARVILHVDTNGTARLLQRVLAATDTNQNSRVRFFATEAAVPAALTARRISSLILDTANREVTGTGEFGKHSTFGFTVGERSKENPFRHAWHPDHDGRNATYDGLAPSGDNPANYLGPVKPETFSVTNKIEFVWYDAAGNPTFSWNPEEAAYGRCDWTLTGLRIDTPVLMRGVFILKRVSANAELEH